MSLRYTTIIFDFHGTVTDHQLRLIKAYHTAGHKAFGIHLPKEFYQQTLTRPSYASGNPQTNKEYIRQQFLDQENRVDYFMEVHKSLMDSTYIPIPRMRHTIRQLQALGINIVLLTNGTNRESIKKTLYDWDQEGFYSVRDLGESLYSSHVSGVKKPDPEAVNFIFRDLEREGKNVNPTHTLLVGDSIVDAETSYRTGLDLALLVRGNGQETFKLRFPQPKYIITEPHELITVSIGEQEIETREEVTIQPVLWTAEEWYRANPEKR